MPNQWLTGEEMGELVRLARCTKWLTDKEESTASDRRISRAASYGTLREAVRLNLFRDPYASRDWETLARIAAQKIYPVNMLMVMSSLTRIWEEVDGPVQQSISGGAHGRI